MGGLPTNQARPLRLQKLPRQCIPSVQRPVCHLQTAGQIKCQRCRKPRGQLPLPDHRCFPAGGAFPMDGPQRIPRTILPQFIISARLTGGACPRFLRLQLRFHRFCRATGQYHRRRSFRQLQRQCKQTQIVYGPQTKYPSGHNSAILRLYRDFPLPIPGPLPDCTALPVLPGQPVFLCKGHFHSGQRQPGTNANPPYTSFSPGDLPRLRRQLRTGSQDCHNRHQQRHNRQGQNRQKDDPCQISFIHHLKTQRCRQQQQVFYPSARHRFSSPP